MQEYFDHFKTSHNSQLNSDDFSAIIINHKLHKSECNKINHKLQIRSRLQPLTNASI